MTEKRRFDVLQFCFNLKSSVNLSQNISYLHITYNQTNHLRGHKTGIVTLCFHWTSYALNFKIFQPLLVNKVATRLILSYLEPSLVHLTNPYKFGYISKLVQHVNNNCNQLEYSKG